MPTARSAVSLNWSGLASVLIFPALLAILHITTYSCANSDEEHTYKRIHCAMFKTELRIKSLLKRHYNSLTSECCNLHCRYKLTQIWVVSNYYWPIISLVTLLPLRCGLYVARSHHVIEQVIMLTTQLLQYMENLYVPVTTVSEVNCILSQIQVERTSAVCTEQSQLKRLKQCKFALLQ